MTQVESGMREAAEIRSLVIETLAQQERLQRDATQLSERPVTRGGRLCGVHFAMQGPRDVLLTAIWDAEAGVLLCYDSSGRRFRRIEAPAAA